MRRREFITTASTLAAVSASWPARHAFAAPAIITGTRDLVLTCPWPARSGGLSDQAFTFARRLERASGGRLKLHLIASPVSGIDAVAAGPADMSFGFEHANVRHHPAFGYFAGLPLGTGMAYETFAGWIADGGAELWDDISARFNVKSLLAGHTGRSPGLWTSQLVHSLNDLAGKRIQTQGLTCDVVRGIGGEPCDGANGDAVAALSAGTLDAIELGSLAHGVASGISRDAKFCMAGGLTTSGSVLSVTFRRDVWHGLGAELKSVVKIVAAAEARRSIAEADANQDILQRRREFGAGCWPRLPIRS